MQVTFKHNVHYLERWIILGDLHSNIVRHVVAIILNSYQSVVDKTWTITKMPSCCQNHQSITIHLKNARESAILPYKQIQKYPKTLLTKHQVLDWEEWK